MNQVLDVNDQVNIAGAGINVGQHVMDCGDAGHIILSQHVAEDLAQYRHLKPHLYDLGEVEVKHGLRLHLVNLHKDGLGNPAIPEKLRLTRRSKKNKETVRPVSRRQWPKWAAFVVAGLALVIGVSGMLRRGSGGQKSARLAKKHCVLPFDNRSEEKSNAYFADGIQDEILTRLSKIADLKVISRTSTQHYRARPGTCPRSHGS